MAQADGTIYINTKINADGVQAGGKEVESACRRASKTINGIGETTKRNFDGIGNSIKNVAKLMLSVFAVGKMVQFGKAAIELGSDLSEVQNVVDVTFGSLNQEVNEFAKNAITQFGLSETAAKQYTSTMGAMLKSMGFTERAAADMGMAMTGLAADMASFYNLSAEEAFYKIRSGISGETEPLKQLGINLSVANLEQYALTQGITKSYKAMTQQEQAMLRYNYLLSVTSDAQGDFSRTSASWANQTRVLSEQFNSLKATIGQGLINLFTPVLQVINQLIARLATLANAFKAFAALITGSKNNQSGSMASGYYDAAAGASDLASSTEDVADATEAAEKAAKGYLSPLDEISKFSEDNSSSGGSGISGGSISGSAVDYGTLEDMDNTVADELTEKLEHLKDVLGGLLKPFRDAWQSQGQPTIESMQTAFNRLKDLAGSVGKSISEVWENGTGTDSLTLILGIVQNIVSAVGNLASQFTTAWEKAGTGTSIVQGLFNLFNTILGTINKITESTAEWASTLDFTPLLKSIDGLLKAMQPYTENIGSGLKWFYDNVLLPLSTFVIEDVVPLYLTKLSVALDAVNLAIEIAKPFLSWLWDSFLQPIASWTGGVITTVLSTITDLLQKLGDWIRENQGIIQAFSIVVKALGVSFMFLASPIGLILSVIKLVIGAFQEFGDWIKSNRTPVQRFTDVLGTVAKALGLLISPFAYVVRAGNLLIENWDKIKQKAVELKDWLVQKWQEIKTGASDIWGKISGIFGGTWSNIVSAARTKSQQTKDDTLKSWESVKTEGNKKWSSIYSTLSSTWTSIRQTASTIWSEIGNKIKTKLDEINEKARDIADKMNDKFKGAFESIKEKAEGAFKSVKDTLGSIWDKVTSTASDIGGKLAGFVGISYSAPTPIAPVPAAPTPKIPYLASGAVIPPRAAFLAVLGDQRNGNNLEMPESLLRKVVREESGNRGFSGSIRIPLYINGRQVMEAVLEEAQLKQMISGRNPFEIA